jgi:DNA invertase Pin-like site-specific DNA recombinase
MIAAAIYARKSTEQTSADADAKSVSRQIENARAFAATKGWTIPDGHVYADNAISGAETGKLVNRQRLLDVIQTGPPFTVLLMRDASRFSRRDGDEAFGELKRIAQAGVTIWFYQDGTPFEFGNFAANITGIVRAEMNAEYRRQIATWTKEAMLRKAKAGHVTGGALFGYDNVRVNGHVERQINEPEAAVIRRIFDLCAAGTGYTRIAKQLNAERARTPRPRKGRPSGWSPSSVREVLFKPLYRGEIIYNQSRRRAPDGTTTFAPRPESEWIRVDRPELRIVALDVWTAAHQRITGIRTTIDRAMSAHGRTRCPRRRDIDSKYLLSGFTRCAECGGSVGVLDRRLYGCIAYHKRGTTVCRNGVKLPVAALDAALLRILRTAVTPKAIMAIVDGLLRELAPAARARKLATRRRELARLDREIANVTTAIARGGQLPSLLAKLQTHQARREAVAATITAHTVEVAQISRTSIERTVYKGLADWQARLTGTAVERTRQMLREILSGPVVVRPEGRAYRFTGELVIGRLLTGEISYQPLWCARADLRPVATLKFQGIAA